MDVCDFFGVRGIVGFGGSNLWPCAQSANGRIRCRKDDIRWFLTFNYIAAPLICCAIVFYASVGLDFADVCLILTFVSLS